MKKTNPYYLFLEQLLKENRMTPNGFQEKFNFRSFSTIFNKLKRDPEKRLHPETIAKIEQAFNIRVDDSDWENITYTYNKTEEASDNKPIIPSLPFLDNMAPVKVYGYVHAGNEGPIFSEDVIEQILIPKGAYSDLYGIIVDGDSMEPIINNRDIVVVSLSAKAKDGNVCLVAYNSHDYVLKRVFFNKDIDLVTLVSDNKKYPPAFVPTSQIKSILPVVGLYKGQDSLNFQG